MMPIALCVLVASCVFALEALIPVHSPCNALLISPSLVGFSIEQDRWTDWVGTTNRNEFFYNTLTNLKHLTGKAPPIRIGACDHTNFNAAVQFSEALFPPPTSQVPYPQALNVTAGDGYYMTVRHLPPGTEVTVGVNFGQSNITAAVLEAHSLARAFRSASVVRANITLEFVEIGNEADQYALKGLRHPSFSFKAYMREWLRFSREVIKAAQITETSRTKLLSGSFLSSTHSVLGFSPQAVLKSSVFNTEVGPLITAFSQHHYSGSFCSGNGGILQDLMNKIHIRGNLSAFIPDMVAMARHGLDYVIGETNSYACHGAAGISNTAGAALWALDYLLYAGKLGVSRVYFHQGIGYKYNAIQPVHLYRSTINGEPFMPPQPPHIQPMYYAAAIASEAIGPTGATTIIELDIDHPFLAGYAFFERGTLVRAILINSHAFWAGDVEREEVRLQLRSTHDHWLRPKNMVVKRLYMRGVNETTGLRWGGQTYETRSGKIGGRLRTELLPVEEDLVIRQSEAIMLSFRYEGSN
ncbi:hypothetical protein HGRIS_002392 [Hohenbuehelia grisea]|uniref:Beta-glucuronidase C-terminal domain-containing protein n=1 Tax=Hohenbuehelia grisea TaxID=104357 RepID=A0ABR3JKE0_9AGAR